MLTVYWHPALINKNGIHPLLGTFSHPSQKSVFIPYKHLHLVLGDIDQATKLVRSFGADDEVYLSRHRPSFVLSPYETKHEKKVNGCWS